MAHASFPPPSNFGRQQNGLFGQGYQQNASNSAQPQLGAAGSNYAANQANNLTAAALQAQYAKYIAYQNLTTPIGVDTSEPIPLKAFKVGEIVAHRGWGINPDGFLTSMSAGAVWAPGEPMEGKTKSATEHNGVYAFKTCKDYLTANLGLPVFGKVALWGDVIEHELGYRAQFAKIISIDWCKESAKQLFQIRELYGVAA